MLTARFALVGALLLTGCASVAPSTSEPDATPLVIYVTPPPTPATTHDIKVTFTLYGDARSVERHYDTCEGDGGYSDIHTGMQANIKDASGDLLGFATFSQDGKPGTTSLACVFETTVQDVADVPVYGVEVGRRGVVNYQRSDLASHNWVAEISLGQ